MLKNILVHLDLSRHCATRLETAVALARRHEAHLTGVYVVSHPDIPPFVQAGISAEIIDAQIRSAVENGERVLADFEARAGAEGVERESRLIEGTVADGLADNSRYFDLVVTGQYDPGDDELHAVDDMPDRLIMSSGRPVLVVPYAGRFPVVGDNVIVSWDGSRQATRAVNDAMPMLESAPQVTVMTVNPDEKGLGDAPGADLSLHLARHGVNATARHVATDGDIDPADMLLSQASDHGADLIVMGAYGHARWREIALGGFTRHMLAHMTVPVLMSN